MEHEESETADPQRPGHAHGQARSADTPTGKSAGAAARTSPGTAADIQAGTVDGRKPRRRFSRRSVLIAGASSLGIAGFAAATATGTLPFTEALQRALGVTSSSGATQPGVARIERVWSQYRGRQVELMTLLPSRNPPRNLPMVLLLHGLRGRARTAPPTGTLAELTNQIARQAVPAFGFVAVDGGDNYWHENHPGDDPMRMLLDEVPEWLRQRGLGSPGRSSGTGGLPFACLGMSMGGFGALVYARRRAERRRPLEALALLAPALMSWPEMSKRRAFDGEQEWASLDPMRHLGATQAVPTGVWCGTEDPFIGGVRAFISATHPAIAYTARGRHGDSFNRTVMPNVIAFLGKYVPKS